MPHPCRRLTGLLALLLLASTSPLQAQSTYTWDEATTNTQWYTAGNWDLTSGPGNAYGFPGETGNASSTNGDIAIINNYTASLSTNGLAINQTLGNNPTLGAIVFAPTTSTASVTLGNSASGVSTPLTLTGATINGVDNVIFSVTGTADLFLRNSIQGGTSNQTIRLGTSTGEAVFYIAPGRVINTRLGISDRLPTRLIVDGGGTLIIDNSNSYRGGTTIRNGSVMRIVSADELGASPVGFDPDNVVLDNGTLRTYASIPNANRGVQIGPATGSGTGTIDIENIEDIVIAGPIANQGSGTGRLIVKDRGTLSLLNTNTFSGGLEVEDAFILFTTDANLGAVPASPMANGIVLLEDIRSPSLQYEGTGDITIHANRGIQIGKSTGTDNGAGILDVTKDTGILRYGGVIANRPAEVGDFTKAGPGLLVLSGASTYTGRTSLSRGTLKLDFTAAGAPTNSIIDGASDLFLGNSASSSFLDIVGKASVTNTQSFSGTQWTTGFTTITATSGSGGSLTVNLDAVSRSAVGQIGQLNLPATGSMTSTTGSPNTILRSGTTTAFLSLGEYDWPAKNASNMAIVPGSSISGFYTPTTSNNVAGNADVASGVNTTLPGDRTISSLRFNVNESRTIDVGTGNLLNTGGILVTPNVGTHTSLITGGSLRGAGTDLVIFQYNTAGPLEIASTITTAPTKGGAGKLILSGNNTHTGTTYVLQGTVEAGSTTGLSSGSTYFISGEGKLRLNGFDSSVAGLTNNTAAPGSLAIAENGSTTPAVLTIGGASTTSSFGAIIQDGGTGSLKIKKVGTGTFTTTGAGSYTYTGGVEVLAGTFKATDSSGTGFGNVIVGTGSFQASTTPTLSGNGTILGSVHVLGHGAIAPDDGGVATLIINNAVTFDPFSRFEVDLRATGSSDKLSVTGASSVWNFLTDGTDKPVIALNDTAVFDGNVPASYAIGLIATGANFKLNGTTIPDGTELGRTIIGGATTGSLLLDTSNFAGLVDGDMFVLTRVGPNLMLTFTPTPEPGAMLVFALAGLALRRGIRKATRLPG